MSWHRLPGCQHSSTPYKPSVRSSSTVVCTHDLKKPRALNVGPQEQPSSTCFSRSVAAAVTWTSGPKMAMALDLNRTCALVSCDTSHPPCTPMALPWHCQGSQSSLHTCPQGWKDCLQQQRKTQGNVHGIGMAELFVCQAAAAAALTCLHVNQPHTDLCAIQQQSEESLQSIDLHTE